MMKDICKCFINVPSNDTPRIQEAHIMIGHIICKIVEKELFSKTND
jgi:D-sedoheptulose 7-phosphate isomerase